MKTRIFPYSLIFVVLVLSACAPAIKAPLEAEVISNAEMKPPEV